MTGDRVCVGVIVGVHGVRGVLKVKSFTAHDGDIAAYGPLHDEAGRRLSLSVIGRAKGVLLARADGIADRTAAEALKGRQLFVARDQLPAPEDEEEYYHADLIGLEARTADGAVLGRVAAVHDFGAGDILEIQGEGSSRLLPFTRAVVPHVRLAEGFLLVDPPVEEGEPEPADQEAAP